MGQCKMIRGRRRESERQRESARASVHEQVGVRQLGVCADLVTEVNLQEGKCQLKAACGGRAAGTLNSRGVGGSISSQQNRTGGLGWAGDPTCEATSQCQAETLSPRFRSALSPLRTLHPTPLTRQLLPPRGPCRRGPPRPREPDAQVNRAALDINQGAGPVLQDFLDL